MSTENAIFKSILEARQGHYVHAVEVSDTYELENLAEVIIQEHRDTQSEGTIIEFLESLTVYYIPEENEQENEEEEQKIYSFSFREFIKGTI